MTAPATTERVRLGASFTAAPHLVREAIQRLIGALDPEGLREGVSPAAMSAIENICDQFLRLRERTAAATVDRDRGIREAYKTAESCEQHGARIRDAEDRLAALSAQLDATEAERVVWVDGMHRIADAHADLKPFVDNVSKRALAKRRTK
jgi:hypothetical protein